jgi:hypothetical protein
MAVVTGRSMSATGVSGAPTLLTIGEATIGSRASWNGVLTYALRWSPSGYPVALATPSQSSRRREGYPGHVVIHGASAQPCTLRRSRPSGGCMGLLI